MNLAAVPKPENPVFIDKVITELQDKLKAKLSWLDYSFGRAQRMIKTENGKDVHYPAVHIGSGEYRNVFPDDTLGNFSFFFIEDPQEVDFRQNAFNNVKVQYALIFWFNLDKIFTGETDRNTEEIKAQIVKAITRQITLSVGRIDIRKIYEQAGNIYRGFNLNELDSAFLTQPYAGFRFEGQISMWEDC
jgi:hypothetical protein